MMITDTALKNWEKVRLIFFYFSNMMGIPLANKFWMFSASAYCSKAFAMDYIY